MSVGDRGEGIDVSRPETATGPMPSPRKRPGDRLREIADQGEPWAHAILAAAERDRYHKALEAIRLHHAMPDGEGWEQAYNEVTTIAIEALDHEGPHDA